MATGSNHARLCVACALQGSYLVRQCLQVFTIFLGLHLGRPRPPRSRTTTCIDAYRDGAALTIRAASGQANGIIDFPQELGFTGPTLRRARCSRLAGTKPEQSVHIQPDSPWRSPRLGLGAKCRVDHCSPFSSHWIGRRLTSMRHTRQNRRQ